MTPDFDTQNGSGAPDGAARDELPNPYETWQPKEDLDDISDAEPYDGEEHGKSRKLLPWPPAFGVDFYDQMRVDGFEPEDDGESKHSLNSQTHLNAYLHSTRGDQARRQQCPSGFNTEVYQRVLGHLQESQDEAHRQAEAWLQEVGPLGEPQYFERATKIDNEITYAPEKDVQCNVTRNGQGAHV